jgi:hypothetical protein
MSIEDYLIQSAEHRKQAEAYSESEIPDKERDPEGYAYYKKMTSPIG